jgi:hypothetical protein
MEGLSRSVHQKELHRVRRRETDLRADNAPLEAQVVLLLAECDLEREGIEGIEDAVASECLIGR